MSKASKTSLMTNISAFTTLCGLARRALSSKKSNRVKLISEYREKLHDSFMKLDSTWQLYKSELLEKEKLNVEEFEEVDTDTNRPKYDYNTKWSEAQMDTFVQLTDDIDEALEESEEKPGLVTPTVEDQERLVSKVKTEITQTESAVDSFVKDMGEVEELTEAKYRGVVSHIEKLRVRTVYTADMALGLEKEVDVDLFRQTVEAKLQSLETSSMLKLKDLVAESSGYGSSSGGRGKPYEKVDLEKSKPPRFTGDMCEYPEFKRRFESIVGKANLPEEAFLDKLRDNLPKDGKEMLYGVTTKTKAWGILDERFGNQKLIALKLKSQLKSVRAEGNNDPEKVISLVIKVRSIETKLLTLSSGLALEHDSEFLSAVYGALPRDYQKQWLLNEGDDNWAAMKEFLEQSYKQANKELALMSSYETTTEKAKSSGKAKSAKTTVKPEKDADDSDHGDKAKRERAKDYCGKCPVCDRSHTWLRRDGKPWPSDRLLSCKKFESMTASQRASAVERCQGCPRCLSWSHKRDQCRMPANSCGKDLTGTRCTGDHSKLLCGSGNTYCAVVSVGKSVTTDMSENEKIDENVGTIFYIQDLEVSGASQTAETFWDTGSNRCIIRDSYATQQDLPSQTVTYTLEAVGGKEEVVTSKIYKLKLVDRFGISHPIWAYGYSHIMSSEAPDMSPLKMKLPHVPKEAFTSMSSGDIDLLMGLNFNHLFPEGGANKDKVGGIKALRSLFGCGWVISGCDRSVLLDGSQGTINPTVIRMRCARVKMKTGAEKLLPQDFFEKDLMGVTSSRVCERCLTCLESGTCSEHVQQRTRKEQAELDLIKGNMEIRAGEVWCKYPFVKDPSFLPNNRGSAIKVAEKVRKDLKRDSMLEAYDVQIKQILDRNAAVKLTKQEKAEWDGPFQYITHHPVLKDSVTTPVRMVTNSSFNNGGSSLNECLVSGPNSLNPMLDVLLRFRAYESVCVYDLSKAYNRLRTTETEKHLRRFVWKFCDDEEWQDYAFDRAHFGDKCVATQLEVAKDMIAELPEAKEIDSEACDKIKSDTYVDDTLTGGTKSQVDRFIGVKDSQTGLYSGTIPQILALGNFGVKGMVRNRETDQEMADLLGNTALGYGWDARTDMLCVKFPVNLSKKKRGVRVKPNLEVSDLKELEQVTLTKRVLLGFINGFGDVLGIAQPWYMRLKMMMKKLYETEVPLEWDDEIPSEQRQSWLDVMTEALVQQELSFPRSTRPDLATGEGPVVAGFADGAVPGYGGCVYLSWPVSNSDNGGLFFETQLVFAKSRVCPLRGYTVPRSEISALLLLSRMMLIVLRALSVLQEKPTSAVLLSDSQCAISSLSSVSRNLLPFFQNRVSEILENIQLLRKFCEVEVLYVPGDQNVADILTRGNVKLADLTSSCQYMRGPVFLSSPRSEWPVSSTVDFVSPPEEEMRLKTPKVWAAAVRATYQTPDLVPSPSNPLRVVEKIAEYSNSLRKVTRILARYLRGRKRENSGIRMDRFNPRALSLIALEPTKQELDAAKHLLLLLGSVQTCDALSAGRLASLLPERKEGLVVTTGRIGEESLLRLLGVTSLPILMPQSRIAWLYMVLAHSGDAGTEHRGIVGTLARSRTHVWIVKAATSQRRLWTSAWSAGSTRGGWSPRGWPGSGLNN